MNLSVVQRPLSRFTASKSFTTTDGNGRVGRLLLPLMFKAEGAPPIHLATFLKVRQREYYDALLAAQTRLNWSPWVCLFLECVIASCQHTIRLFESLHATQGRWRDRIAATRRCRHATILQVADMLLVDILAHLKEGDSYGARQEQAPA